MNSKNIAKVLNKKLTNWVETISDKDVVRCVKENAMASGLKEVF